MAHGSPRYNICNKCSQYIYVARFDEDPICPVCKTKSKQINRDELRIKTQISFLEDLRTSFTKWIKFEST